MADYSSRIPTDKNNTDLRSDPQILHEEILTIVECEDQQNHNVTHRNKTKNLNMDTEENPKRTSKRHVDYDNNNRFRKEWIKYKEISELHHMPRNKVPTFPYQAQ